MDQTTEKTQNKVINTVQSTIGYDGRIASVHGRIRGVTDLERGKPVIKKEYLDGSIYFKEV